MKILGRALLFLARRGKSGLAGELTAEAIKKAPRLDVGLYTRKGILNADTVIIESTKNRNICSGTMQAREAAKKEVTAAVTPAPAPKESAITKQAKPAITTPIKTELSENLRYAMMRDPWGSVSNPKFYRLVGKEELLKILKGEKVKSNRASYGGKFTDITTNPDYSNIMRSGKFRLEFNNKNNAFANSRVHSYAPENSHYHLIGPYDKSDIKAVSYFDGDEFVDLGTIENIAKYIL